MSMFQCENCGCAENSALAAGYLNFLHKHFDFTGQEEKRGKRLCSACTPHSFGSGEQRLSVGWHGNFPRVYLAPGEYHTDREGDLVHTATGRKDYWNMALSTEAM